ncbi:MAG: hypothetical protein WD069_22665 [Planctomycetales bacterium]
MVHSHLPVRHLMKQIENFQPKGSDRDVRPAWVSRLIDRVAELFEPLEGIGRVGFDCHLSDECWIVEMYLGSTELVGGPGDGQRRMSDFRFDLLALVELFGPIERFRWTALCAADGEVENVAAGPSSITVEGRIDDNPVRLQLYSVPPPDTGPGFRRYPDGRHEPV